MSEGDSIHFLARRLRPALEGRVVERAVGVHPRTACTRFGRLDGSVVERVEALGKHLLLRFGCGLVVHSHLGMSGGWRAYAREPEWPLSRRVWLALETDAARVVQRGGPTLELLTDGRCRSHPRLASLGPDICADEFDAEAVVRRLREDDPTRPVGDALLDQTRLAGIGNLWKVEGCWLAGVSPWRPLGSLRDEDLLRIVGEVRPRIRDSALRGTQTRYKLIYGTHGRPCPRCGDRIRQRPQGDANRLTYWCAGCQR